LHTFRTEGAPKNTPKFYVAEKELRNLERKLAETIDAKAAEVCMVCLLHT